MNDCLVIKMIYWLKVAVVLKVASRREKPLLDALSL